jgi:hypothetical protein
MVTLLATEATLAPAAEATAEVTRPAFAGPAGRAFVTVGLVLCRGLVLTGRGIAWSGRAAAWVFASTFDAAVTTAGARDDDGRPLNIWPPKLG